MGHYTSSLRDLVSREFKRLAGSKRYLTCGELAGLQTSGFSYAVDLTHLPTLYLIDNDGDGRFSLKDVLTFVHCLSKEFTTPTPSDFVYDVRAFATEQVLQRLEDMQGTNDYVDWVVKVVKDDQPVVVGKQRRNDQMVEPAAARLLHQLLKVEQVQDLDFQAFLDVLHKVAEELQLSPTDPDKSDWLPESVLKIFIASAAGGMSNIANQMFSQEPLS